MTIGQIKQNIIEGMDAIEADKKTINTLNRLFNTLEKSLIGLIIEKRMSVEEVEAIKNALKSSFRIGREIGTLEAQIDVAEQFVSGMSKQVESKISKLN